MQGIQSAPQFDAGGGDHMQLIATLQALRAACDVPSTQGQHYQQCVSLNPHPQLHPRQAPSQFLQYLQEQGGCMLSANYKIAGNYLASSGGADSGMPPQPQGFHAPGAGWMGCNMASGLTHTSQFDGLQVQMPGQWDRGAAMDSVQQATYGMQQAPYSMEQPPPQQVLLQMQHQQQIQQLQMQHQQQIQKMQQQLQHQHGAGVLQKQAVLELAPISGQAGRKRKVAQEGGVRPDKQPKVEGGGSGEGRMARARQKQGGKWHKEAAVYKAERGDGGVYLSKEPNQLVAFRHFLQAEATKGVVRMSTTPARLDLSNPLGVEGWQVTDVDVWWADVMEWFEDEPHKFSYRAFFMMLRRMGYKPINKAPLPATSGLDYALKNRAASTHGYLHDPSVFEKYCTRRLVHKPTTRIIMPDHLHHQTTQSHAHQPAPTCATTGYGNTNRGLWGAEDEFRGNGLVLSSGARQLPHTLQNISTHNRLVLGSGALVAQDGGAFHSQHTLQHSPTTGGMFQPQHRHYSPEQPRSNSGSGDNESASSSSDDSSSNNNSGNTSPSSVRGGGGQLGTVTGSFTPQQAVSSSSVRSGKSATSASSSSSSGQSSGSSTPQHVQQAQCNGSSGNGSGSSTPPRGQTSEDGYTDDSNADASSTTTASNTMTKYHPQPTLGSLSRWSGAANVSWTSSSLNAKSQHLQLPNIQPPQKLEMVPHLASL